MSALDSFDERLPVPATEAVGLGVGAYVVGVIATFVLEGSGQSQQFMQGVQAGAMGANFQGLSPPSDFELSGMLYHVAHVGVEISLSATGQGQSVNMGMGGDMLQAQYLMLIPPLVLAGAGYLLVQRNPDAEEEPTRVGASVAVGYVVAMVVGALLVFSWSGSSQVSSGFQTVQVTFSMGPDLLTSLLFGAGYGVAFGGAGGYVYEETQEPEAVDDSAGTGEPPSVDAGGASDEPEPPGGVSEAAGDE